MQHLNTKIQSLDRLKNLLYKEDGSHSWKLQFNNKKLQDKNRLMQQYSDFWTSNEKHWSLL